MSVQRLQDELQQQVHLILTTLHAHQQGSTDSDLADEYDFWCDPSCVLYDSDPNSEAIDAVAVDDLELTDPYIARVLNKDIVDTYLSTGDFAILLTSTEDKHGRLLTAIGVVDRSTGVAMINPEDLFDEEHLSDASEIALANTENKSNLQPIQRCYKLVTSSDLGLPQETIDFSRRRLSALLTDIDVHILARYLDSEVQVRDDL